MEATSLYLTNVNVSSVFVFEVILYILIYYYIYTYMFRIYFDPFLY